MKLTDHLRHLRLLTTILGLTILSSLAFPADHQRQQDQQTVIELGSTEIEATARIPAAAGGNVFIHVRVTLRTSQDVVRKINEGISSGKYQAPFGTNEEFMDLVLGSRPGSFEVEFLDLNKESRFYYFFEEQLKEVTTHPSIPDELRRRAKELARNAKALLYQTIRPNDFRGARILFEQGSEVGSIVFLGSTKRKNQPVGKVTFTDKERPIYEAIKRALSEHKPRQPSTPAPENKILDDIIKLAQKRNILISKD